LSNPTKLFCGLIPFQLKKLRTIVNRIGPT
jgi:hypothetical protein